MLTLIGRDVKQQGLPEGEIVNQLPPLLVAAFALKRMVELSVAGTVISWGSGLAPPNGMTKLIGFT